MQKKSDIIRTIVEIGLFVALGFVFDELQSIIFKGVFPAGGSIGFAMIAVILITYRRGPIAGVLTGLLMGALDICTGPFIVNPWQALLDYVFPYALVSTCAIFVPFFRKAEKQWVKTLFLILSVVIGGLFKFLSHYLSGVIFFNHAEEFAWNLTTTKPALYSLIYNIAYMGPCIVLTSVLTYVLYKRLPKFFDYQLKVEEAKQESIKSFDYLLEPSLIVLGLFLIIFFGVRYKESFYIEQYEYWEYVATDVSVNVNALMLMLNGIMITISATIAFIKSLRKEPNYRLTLNSYAIVSFANIFYAIARIIRLYRKYPTKPEKMAEFNYNTTIMWAWFGISILLTVLFVTFYLYLKEFNKKASNVEA